LAALGMMMFPIFTVYVTSLVQKANLDKKEYLQQTSDNSVSAGRSTQTQTETNP